MSEDSLPEPTRDLAQLTVVPHGDQLSAEIGDEVVILNVESEKYFGLNPVGARIWQLIQDRRPLTEIRDIVLTEFDVDAERCERDLLHLVDRLREEGLVTVRTPDAR